MKTEIPHKCVTCDCKLYLENRQYFKGKYFCDNCFKKRKSCRGKK